MIRVVSVYVRELELLFEEVHDVELIGVGFWLCVCSVCSG